MMGFRLFFIGILASAVIGAGVAFLIFKPIAAIVAYVAIGYGAWTIWKKEK